MSVTARLVFDPADASSGHNVGSYVRAGDDGTLIGHVSDALKVSFTNTSLAVTATDLDIRDLAFATDKVDVSGSSVSISGSVTVTATDLDIRDLTAASDSVASWTMDGTGNAIGSTTGALNVYVAGGFTDIDDSLANTAIATESVAVSTSAVNATASALSNRKWFYVANEGNKSIYIGTTGVSASNGFPIHRGQQSEFRIGAAVMPKLIGATGASSEDIRVMQLS